MNNKKRYTISFSIFMALIIISIFITSQWNKKEEETMKIQKKETVEKIMEERTVQVSIDKEFEKDDKKLAYKTNKKGELRATYIFSHTTQKKEKIIFYAMMEENEYAVIMDIDGKKARYHTIDVPKEGQVKIDFTLSDLPPGEHIIYIFNEKVIDNKISNELEKIQTQQVFSENFFSLDVHNNNMKAIKIDDSFKTIKKIGDSYEGSMLSMQLYEEPKMSREASSVNKSIYYLVINNHVEFELKAHLRLLSDYSSEKLEQIILPANSQLLLPVNLENLKAQESIRFVLFGEPTNKVDVQFPVRIVYKSARIPIE